MPTSGSAATPDSPLAGLYLLTGEEEFLIARAISELVTRAKRQFGDCEVTDCLAKDVMLGQLAELFSPSLFGDARLILIRDTQDATKDFTSALLALVTQLPTEIVLVATHAGGAKGKAVADGLRKAGAAITQCARLTQQRQRVAFVHSEITRHGGRCDEQTATQILEAVGGDLRELSSVCAQLVADTGGRVDGEAVAQYHRGKAEANGFSVADAVMAGDLAAALEALRWALSIGVDPVPIADALADGVRSVARVANANKGSAYQVASELGMPPWKVERSQRQARGWSPAALATAMSCAAELNGAVKGGSDNRGYALEKAVLTIVQARQQQ